MQTNFMRITEIKVADKIEIEAMSLNGRFVYSSHVVSINPNNIEIEPIGGIDMITISQYNMIINIYYYGNDASVIFRNCRIQSMVQNGICRQFVLCFTESEENTKRLCERVEVGKWGSLTVKDEDIYMEAYVNDMSMNGFAVVVDKMCPNLLSKEIRVVFVERLEKIVLDGRVVRNSLIGGRKVFIGCYLENSSDNTLLYIQKKMNGYKRRKDYAGLR